jgi:hypothetical protein
MTSQMQRALIELSTSFDPEPSAVFQRIVATLSDLYGGTMAMVNLAERECVRFRAISNPHPALEGVDFLPFSDTY